jgi:hypothetical protein
MGKEVNIESKNDLNQPKEALNNSGFERAQLQRLRKNL